MSDFSVIGKPIALVDSAGKTTGAGKYTDDLSLPGMLIGKILHSPYPHAKIKHIDASRALAMDGPEAVSRRREASKRFTLQDRARRAFELVTQPSVEVTNQRLA